MIRDVKDNRREGERVFVKGWSDQQASAPLCWCNNRS